MSIDLFCPKCEASEHILEENDIEFNGLTVSLSNSLLTTGVIMDTASVFTCSSCGNQYQNGDYQKQQHKLTATRLALTATQNGSQRKAASIYGIIGILIALIAYKLFNTNYTIFGSVCSAIAATLLLIAITGFIFTPRKKR